MRNETLRLTHREREKDTNIGIKGVLGVVRFSSFTSVLEKQEAIEVFLRELHVVRTGRRRGCCCCERNCVGMCCELCTMSQVLGFEIYDLSNCYTLTLQLCACAAGSDSSFCFKAPGLLCSHVLHSLYGPSPTYVLD